MTNKTDESDYEMTGDRIAVSIIGIIGIFLNAATFMVMLDNFTKIFSKMEACFVTNLCLADLGTNINALLWAIFPASRHPHELILTLYCLMWATVSASFLTLLVMAVERLFLVIKPIKARNMQLTSKRSFACTCCVVVWFISIVAGSMIALNVRKTQCAMVVIFEISLIAIIGCYVCINFNVTKLNRRNRFRTAAHYSTENMNLKLKEEENKPALHHRVAVSHEARITNLVFVLILILTITVLPYMLLLQIAVALNVNCPSCEWPPSMILALDVLFPIEMLNFVINPAVYAWRLPKFRQASKKTFSRVICCKKWKSNTEAVARAPEAPGGSLDSSVHNPVTSRNIEPQYVQSWNFIWSSSDENESAVTFCNVQTLRID